ncbi:hypothetical protein NDU88_008733 [Pleurodeles waltl]|uniref:Uncharacterized protein n=1 Tax=Pleurodeles waltl TaxID=8319 RepID=A0AAV7QVG5_PLEWA|nr:hypothetical protein NDU88_008733 [Pleurodeles waltl]
MCRTKGHFAKMCHEAKKQLKPCVVLVEASFMDDVSLVMEDAIKKSIVLVVKEDGTSETVKPLMCSMYVHESILDLMDDSGSPFTITMKSYFETQRSMEVSAEGKGATRPLPAPKRGCSIYKTPVFECNLLFRLLCTSRSFEKVDSSNADRRIG